ncbi:poly-gamma-glutamate hydrolase family protein, partial [Staphylococcus epidermidis]|uniref:poly-gamma-glutamate hydrolase family protein n=1 Tax=Staphylococcus epidermidis TaxID=1282 RepID=UPI0016428875
TTTKPNQFSTPTTSKTHTTKSLLTLPSTQPKIHKYQSITHLQKQTTQPLHWTKHTKNTPNQLLILPPHPPTIQQPTTQLTKPLPDKRNCDCYSFQPIPPKNNSQLHLTSTHYHHPTLNQIIKNPTPTISIHPPSPTDHIIYLGAPRSDLTNA